MRRTVAQLRIAGRHARQAKSCQGRGAYGHGATSQGDQDGAGGLLLGRAARAEGCGGGHLGVAILVPVATQALARLQSEWQWVAQMGSKGTHTNVPRDAIFKGCKRSKETMDGQGRGGSWW